MKIAMKAIREQKEVSVDELAATSGISKSTIWAYEAGRRSPGPEELCALADALDCSLDLLVRGKEIDRPETGDFTLLYTNGNISSDILRYVHKQLF